MKLLIFNSARRWSVDLESEGREDREKRGHVTGHIAVMYRSWRSRDIARITNVTPLTS